MSESIIPHLEQFFERELISRVEIEYVRFLLQLYPDTPGNIQWAAAACLNAQQRGHVCLDINELSGYLFDEPETGIKITPSLKQEWMESLQQCEWIGNGVHQSPMVLEESRLYIHRFWTYENELANWMLRKSEHTHSLTETQAKVIQRLVPPSGELFEVNWQHVALCLSFLKDLVVISGGPGTGKTYTVLNIIAAQAAASASRPPRIALAAPTGKAARRLVDSIQAGKKNLPDFFTDNLKLPEEAYTVHKLLGAGYRGNQFKYHEEEKLPYDLVVVDEASMLDITMWVRLIRALDDHCKLVILGDKDQLASVEAGSILGDICGGENSFSEDIVKGVASVSGMQIPVVSNKPAVNDTVVFLTKSYRFGTQSGIGKFADAVNRSDADEAFRLLREAKYGDLQWKLPSSENMQNLIKEYALDHYQEYIRKPVDEQLQASNQKKVLCALRRGPFGVEYLNQMSERAIKRNTGRVQSQQWYPGRVIMSTRNDSVLKVRNGELGICLGEMDFTINFEGEDALKVSPSRLMNYEPAFAITIHKSQGSEFDEVAIILPDKMNAIVSKEIIYTAVTRARKDILIIAEEEVLRKAINHSVKRQSGLKQKIWNM